MTTLKQRSTAWRKYRAGMATASRFADVMTEWGGKSPYSVVRPDAKAKQWWIELDGKRIGESTSMRKLADEVKRELDAADRDGKLSATAETYLDELVAEMMTGQPIIRAENAAMRWGTDWESSAREAAMPIILEKFGHDVRLPDGEWAFIKHRDEDGIGCSPDGIVGDDGLCEIKCPYNSANHVCSLRNPEYFATRHKAQIQGSLWVTGRQRYYLVSYDHRFKDYALWVSHVDRDEEYIDEMAAKVCRFRDRVLEVYRQLVGSPF
jgi:hypothetical protein